MPDFLFDLPHRTLAIYCAAATVGITWLGIVFIKPFLRWLVGSEPNINSRISYATSVFTLFYGLLLGLLAVAAFQNVERVEAAAFREASELSNLYADLESYPEPSSSTVQSLLRDYVLFTIYKDWPAHSKGKQLAGGRNRANTIRQVLMDFEPKTRAQEIVHREVIAGFHKFTEARQERLTGVIVQIPSVLWYAVIVGGIINIILLIMLKITPIAHLILGGLTSFFLGVILFVIIALDSPLRGEAGVSPAPYEILWARVMAWDEPININ